MKKLFSIISPFIMLISIIACGQSKREEMVRNKNTDMVIGIIGSGNVGGTLGKKWAKAGYQVLFSSRHPEKLEDLVKAAGVNAKAVPVETAAKEGTIIILALPFTAEATVSKQILPYIKDKIVVLCDNAYSGRDGDIAMETEKVGVAYYAQQHYYPTVKLVRAFSSLPVSAVESATADHPIAIPYAIDDDNSYIRATVEQLIRDVDGEPQYTGKIKASKALDY